MKKIVFNSFIVFTLLLSACVFAQNSFTKALRTCEKYSQLGGVALGDQYYNILITLDKNKKSCTYNEKIYQSSGYQLLSCNFKTEQLGTIADIMDNFTEAYKKEVAKNKIYEAKLTNTRNIVK